MSKPVPIGLVVTLEDENDSVINPKPVEAAGGTPLILPYSDKEETIESILDLIGGLLLAGGKDVAPEFYEESPHPKLGEVEPLRDPAEFRIIAEALTRDMPILGVCRGIQTLNVAAGGTLYQDIPSFVPTDIQHSNPWDAALDPESPQEHHPIEIDPSSRLFKIVKAKSLVVNSYHHQSVKDLAPGFKVSARCSDSIVEAVESLKHGFVLGVQCHIELLWDKDPRWLALYRAFIEASADYYKRVHG